MTHHTARSRGSLLLTLGSAVLLSLLATNARAQQPVTFTTFGGTEWWVEAYVEAPVDIAEVDVSVEGGAWRALSLHSWGGWATSLFVEPGSRLAFRALSGDGQIATSALYLWPSGELVAAREEAPAASAPLDEGSPGETFAVSFSAPRGDHWWLEVDLRSTTTIDAVDARSNGGVWTPLARTGWGSWAASWFVPAGSVVELRALSNSGDVARSPGYRWPSGEVVFPPPEEDEPTSPPSDPPEPAPSVPGNVVVPFDDARVHHLGRMDDRVEGEPACSWTGCGFVLVTDATNVSMEVEATVRNGNSDYLRVQLDDAEERVVELVDGSQQVLLASNLSSGAHTITLYKRTEPQVGTVRFLELRLEGGDLIGASSPAGPRMLFIGDSITAAYGNVGAGPFCGFTPATEDGWRSYANLTAQRLGGEAVITAFSGKGVYQNRSPSDPWTMPLIFDRLDVFDASSHASFANIDAVVINLGTNDFASSNPPAQPFVDTYVSFVEDLRGHFPAAPIVLALGPMLSDEWPEGLEQRSTLRAYLEEVIASRAAAGDSDVYLVDHAPQSTEDLLGCDYHPHATTHERMANELSEALSLIAGW